MKKIISGLLSLTAASAFLLNNQPAQAHFYRNHFYGGGFYHDGFYNGGFYRGPYYRGLYPLGYCYPVTRWSVNEDPAYHPHAYSDGYRQGRESAKRGDSYKERTAGGEFARGFYDGYYGEKFTGQKQIVANVYQPLTTCD